MTNEIKSQVIPKISIFIDWSNIFVYAHYFSAEDPNNEGQQRFHEGLKPRGFLVHTHELVERPGKYIVPTVISKLILTAQNAIHQ
jgi:hypothetical protein